MIGRGAAASADEVDEAVARECGDGLRHRLGCLVVLAERVGQAGVRVAGDETVGDAREVGDVGAHLVGAERAVESDGERARVTHRVPERLARLPRQGAAGGVGDRAGDDDGPAPPAFLEQLLQREDRGLRVERVKDRLDEHEVDAAVGQAAFTTLKMFTESDEAKEGIHAFNEKRKPDFSPYRGN